MGEAKRRRRARPSPDSPFFELAPLEAAAKLLEDPTELYLRVSEFCKMAGISLDEFRKEAGAGRLVVQGIKRGPMHYSDVCVRASDALDWMARRRMAN